MTQRHNECSIYKYNNLLEYIFIIAWLMLAGVSNMAYFADENQNHNNSGRFYVIILSMLLSLFLFHCDSLQDSRNKNM